MLTVGVTSIDYRSSNNMNIVHHNCKVFCINANSLLDNIALTAIFRGAILGRPSMEMGGRLLDSEANLLSKISGEARSADQIRTRLPYWNKGDVFHPSIHSQFGPPGCRCRA